MANEPENFSILQYDSTYGVWFTRVIPMIDAIAEATASHGVAIDGWHIKDGGTDGTFTGGANTFNITKGTAVLDIAAACTVDIDKGLTVNGSYATTIASEGQANVLTLNESLTIGDGSSGTLTFSQASKVLTIADTLTFNTASVGALRVATAANVVGNLAVGTLGQILRGAGAGTVPAWTTATYPATITAYALLVATGTNVIGELAVGGAGKLLMGASAAVPIWTTPTYPNTATAGKVLIGDGTNVVLSTPTFPNASATTLKYIRSDGTNWIASTSTLPDSYEQGDILYSSAANVLSALPHGATAGQMLRTGGHGANPAWSTPTWPNTATLGKVLVGDGTNWIESTPKFPNASATAGKFIISDGTDWIASTPTLPNVATGTGKILRADGTNWAATTATFADTYAKGDIVRASDANVVSGLTLSVPAGAALINVLGVVNGETLPTWKAALDATNPTTIGIGDSAAPGTATVFAHRDHQHASPSTWTATAHNLLSAIHGDTLADTVVRGDILVGNSTPKWARKAKGGAGVLVTFDANDVVYTTATYPGTATTTGAYLRADGTNWITSTLILPNAAGKGALVVATAANTWGDLAVGLTTEILVGGGAATVPAWSTDLPTAVTIGTKYIYRAEGTDIPPTDGGTGVSNAADHTITLAGPFSTVGHYTLELTCSNNTAVTLPTTGTLATTAQLHTQGHALDSTTDHNSIGSLTSGYVPYIATNKFANSPIYTDGSGNSGVGTTAPLQPWVVSKAGAEGVEFVPGNSAGLSLIQAYNRTDSTYDILEFDALSFKFDITGGTDVIFDSSGSVLIGATAAVASEQLLVYKSADSNLTQLIVKNASTGIAAAGRATISSNSSDLVLTAFGSNFTVAALADSCSIAADSTASNGLLIETEAAAPIRFSTNGYANEAMRILSGGAVLIGATAAVGSEKLLVSGMTDLGGKCVFAAGDTVLLVENNTTDLITVLGSGNVGFNTTVPDTCIHICGDYDGSSALPGTNCNKGITLTKKTGNISEYGLNDLYGLVFASSSNNNNDYPVAAILAEVTEVDSYVGGSLHFCTHEDHDATLLKRLTIGPTGGVCVGDSATDDGLHNLRVDGTLHVDGVATLASIVCEGTASIGGVLFPDSSNDHALGDTTHMWSDLFLGDGAVVNFNNGDVTLTHASNLLTLAGGNFAVSGTATAKASELVFSGTDTVDAAECYGTILNNYGQADDATITLPTIESGMCFTVILGTTVAKYYRVKAGTNDKIYLDGVAGSDNGYVGIASAVAGASLMFVAFQTGAGAYDWYCSTICGSWVAG